MKYETEFGDLEVSDREHKLMKLAVEELEQDFFRLLHIMMYEELDGTKLSEREIQLLKFAVLERHTQYLHNEVLLETTSERIRKKISRRIPWRQKESRLAFTRLNTME